jgi:hypothetical protein
MKTLTKFLILLVVCAMLIAADAPPQLPSSFWGYVQGGRVGQVVTVAVNNVTVARATIFFYQGSAVYTINVPMDAVQAGTLASFRVGGVAAGNARLYSGTNARLDLRVVVWRLYGK